MTPPGEQPRDVGKDIVESVANTEITVPEKNPLIHDTMLEEPMTQGEEMMRPVTERITGVVTKGEPPVTLEEVTNPQGPLATMLPEVSLGFVLGYGTGYALRVIGRMALFLIGLAFLGIQFLAAYDIVTVDWLQLDTLTKPWLNENGKPMLSALWSSITKDIPFTGSFVGGFILGAKI